MAESYLGSGDLYIDRLTDAGVSQGYALIGNATKLEIKAESEVKEQISKGRDTYGQVLASATLAKPTTLAITLNQLDRVTLAMAFLGEQAARTVVGASITDEEITAPEAGKYVELDYRGVSSVTVENKAGHDASAWASETAYAEGAVVNPENDHWYKATTGGTSDTTEPTWPTDGSTVVDGTVTWTDMGTVAMAADTDYALFARLGWIKPLSGGAISEGDDLYISYTYAGESGYRIKGATEPTIKAKLMLDGKNYVTGKDNLVYIWEAQLSPTSAVDWLADDFGVLELSGTLVTPDGYDAPFRVDQLD